ncbi:competence protein CoiA [Lactiplantibacillus pingfangensis]|uniref:competence protein CoiA n=1 Tax=Lactiplantibacillus pingfangensis TaxID=2559915 RepID=UPI001CC6689B|nr:competence protein CoiA family protein [Lactiplantibacillus pingfangensis]
MAEDARQQLIMADSAKRQVNYWCPGCHAPVRLKHGTVMVAHFAHQANEACDTFSEGETAEHLLGKQQLAAWFAAAGYTVQIEARLPEIHQRPDVLVRLGEGQPLALEFQCSPIALEQLTQRTQGYRDHGYRVLWLLGSPYQHRLRTNSNALKFLQYYATWGCFLCYWLTRENGIKLLSNLMTIDGEPLSYQHEQWSAKQISVLTLLAHRPVKLAEIQVPDHFRQYQQRLLLGRLSHQAGIVSLQTACYQQGGTLAQLPSWVFITVAKIPILKTTYLNWYLAIFLALRGASRRLGQQELRLVILKTLQPRLAIRPCLRSARHLKQTLVDTVISELITAAVIVPQAAGWQLQASQLAWRKG